MKVNMKSNLRRNAAVISAAAIIGALGIGGVMSAQADTPSGTTQQVSTNNGDGDGEVPDATEQESDGETNDDATDVGPDANPNEPGHQDASDTRSGEVEEAGDGDGEVPDAAEQESDGETNDDATDVGPDANPNEPGHQDASDTQSGQ